MKCNKDIKCTVTPCKYNSNDELLCTLDSITVGTHEANPTKAECTDCMSFRLK